VISDHARAKLSHQRIAGSLRRQPAELNFSHPTLRGIGSKLGAVFR
jgi:hypothetical protein